jgi:hypothetical protein
MIVLLAVDGTELETLDSEDPNRAAENSIRPGLHLAGRLRRGPLSREPF